MEPEKVSADGTADVRHKWYPFIPGVMERSYTDEELKNIDPPDFEFEDKTFTAYEATQYQRKMETAMRALKRKMEGYKAAGDNEAYTAASARYRALSAKYTQFSKKANLPEQRQRLATAKSSQNSLANSQNFDRIRSSTALKQEGHDADIPTQYVNDYSECEPLTLTDGERNTFRNLQKLGSDTGHEYGVAIASGVPSEPFTSRNVADLQIPAKYLEAENVKLYHCHTNSTVFSKEDLSHLTRKNVAEIGVITSNGDVFTARRGYGDLVPVDEFYRVIESEQIERQAYLEAMESADFFSWTNEQRSYARIRSQMRLIVRRFGWSISGGRV